MSDEADKAGHSQVRVASYDNLATMLRRLEWAGSDCSPYGGGCDRACPVCGANRDLGFERDNGTHAPTCDLATLLRELP